jgi:hypothetical protein
MVSAIVIGHGRSSRRAYLECLCATREVTGHPFLTVLFITTATVAIFLIAITCIFARPVIHCRSFLGSLSLDVEFIGIRNAALASRTCAHPACSCTHTRCRRNCSRLLLFELFKHLLLLRGLLLILLLELLQLLCYRLRPLQLLRLRSYELLLCIHVHFGRRLLSSF